MEKINLENVNSGDIVYMSDILDNKNFIPVNYRGVLNNKIVVVWDGSQMAIDSSRIFTKIN
jgi:hypothetical protein